MTRVRRWTWLWPVLATCGVLAAILAATAAEAQERPRPPAEAPLLDGLDGLLGGFLDGLVHTFHRSRRVSIIARDWDAAQLLTGQLSATDQVMRERSRRMVLMRARLAEGPFVPFLQLGLGQWRVDPDMPAMPHDVVLAGQVGAGTEWRITDWGSIALEAECTMVNPSRGEARWLRNSALWGSFLAARMTF